MAPSHPPPPVTNGKKRKEPPTPTHNNSSKRAKNTTHQPNRRPDFRSKQREARTLSTQTTSKAFRHGELDVDKFVRSREYEIRALEEGMARSKKALTKRAFQQVPRDLRRRTASHNVKKVPKRLRARGKREVCLEEGGYEQYWGRVTADADGADG